MLKTIWVIPSIFFLSAACQKEETARAPEPPVHNAVTEYVDNRVTAMTKTQTTAGTAKERIQQTQQQAQSVQEP